jgi:hypothetical protein
MSWRFALACAAVRTRWMIAIGLAGCVHAGTTAAPGSSSAPAASVAPGNCGDPAHDGVIGPGPRIEHADRDLDGDGLAELVVVDRNKCSSEGNCYWNVFAAPRQTGDCARYLGTFEGAALEALTTRGDDRMTDVRAYYNQHGGRLLLQSYRFTRGGYRITDVLQCKRASDDRLECADTNR